MIVRIENKYVISVEERLLFSEKLEYIKRIFDSSIESINPEVEDIENKYFDELGKDLLDLDASEMEYHLAEIEKLKIEAINFPQILLKSSIVSAYSAFEYTLTKIRLNTENDIVNKVKFKHLKSSGNEIENTVKFLELVYNLNLKGLAKDFLILKKHLLIRNCIVHQNGNINNLTSSFQLEIKKYISNKKSLIIKENGDIELSKEYVIEFINFMHLLGFSIIKNFQIESSN